MIEAYAFLAAFAVQILVASVLYPAWVFRHTRAQAARVPPERLVQLYPGIEPSVAWERFLTRHRTLTMSTGVLGLLILGWLVSYLRSPDWNGGVVELLVVGYFLVAHLLPVGLLVWLGVRFNRECKGWLPEGKRTAALRRRGLLDFVSPFIVVLGVLSYLLFVAFVIYLQRYPLLGFAGIINLGALTLGYAVNAFTVYVMLYGRRSNPFEAHADRLHRIGLTVKSNVYSCIAIAAYLLLNLLLRLLDLERWEPFALSVFFVICALLSSMGFTARPSKPEADGAGQSLT